jgi:hypothetical protein
MVIGIRIILKVFLFQIYMAVLKSLNAHFGITAIYAATAD